MTDIALDQLGVGEFGISLNASGGDLLVDDGLETAVTLSLFTDRRLADGKTPPDGSTDPRGWWGDIGDGDGAQLGSHLWLLWREKITSTTIADAIAHCKAALQWMLDDGIARTINVTAERAGLFQISIAIEIIKPSGKALRYAYLWGGQAAKEAARSHQKVTHETMVDQSYWDKIDYSWSSTMPPIFVVAYGIPLAAQWPIIAKYPLAVLDQGYHPEVYPRYDSIRDLNPDIKLIGYQVVLEHAAHQTGPGAAVVNATTDPSTYCINNTGSTITYVHGATTVNILVGQPITYWNGTHDVKLRDYRSPLWQAAFLSACDAILEAYPFDGLFLDNCGTLPMQAPGDDATQEEMQAALIGVIEQIRANHPDKIIIGNGPAYYATTFGREVPAALNGSMTETFSASNPFLRLAPEGAIRTYTPPIMNMFVDLRTSATDEAGIKAAATMAFKNRMMYAVEANYISYTYPPIFDEIKAAYYKQLGG